MGEKRRKIKFVKKCVRRTIQVHKAHSSCVDIFCLKMFTEILLKNILWAFDNPNLMGIYLLRNL